MIITLSIHNNHIQNCLIPVVIVSGSTIFFLDLFEKLNLISIDRYLIPTKYVFHWYIRVPSCRFLCK